MRAIALSDEDWQEIYHALQTKIDVWLNADWTAAEKRKAVKHLGAIMERIERSGIRL